MPQEIIKQRLSLLSTEYTDIFTSGYTNLTAATFGKFLKLTDEQTQILENGIALYLLLFLNKDDLVYFLITECSIEPVKAENTVMDIIDGLPNTMVQAQTEAYTKLQALDTTSAPLITNTDRLNVLKSLTKSKMAHFYDIHKNELMEKLLHKYNLPLDFEFETLRTLLGDIIFGFYKIEDTVPLLQQELELDAKTAALLGADILDFLAPLSNPNWQPPVEQDIETVATSANESFDTQNVNAVMNEQEPILTTTLPELRTMAADMAEGRSPMRSTFNAAATIDEPTYQSTQPTIEKKVPEAPSYTAPLYQPPKPNVDAPLEKPRWG